VTPEKIYTITELTARIRAVIEGSFPVLWVVGEISGYKLHTSGHQYFTLKDENSQLPCVLWRGRTANLPFRLQDGMKVMAQGQLTVFEKGGRYQFDVIAIQQAGIGELAVAFEQLKKKLAVEGLFDTARKRPIPPYPERIGIVTSATGAAIRDIVTICHRRWRGIDLILRPAQVQGEGAAEDIAQGIKDFNDWGQVDVLIVGRGGGSLEDLWAFNEEPVVRAVVASKIPVVSAVGHEVDVTLCDLAADLRAPTPSAAAELVVKDSQELSTRLQQFHNRSSIAMVRILQRNRDRLLSLANHWAFKRPIELVRNQSQRLDDLEQRFSLSLSRYVTTRKERLHRLQTNLTALDPSSVLRRGYSITRQLPDRTVLRDSQAVSKGKRISITLHRGEIEAEVQTVQ
jgi:exodeoxyribonuclease VII large subunit